MFLSLSGNWVMGGIHTPRPSSCSIPGQAMHRAISQYVPQVATPKHLSRYLVARNAVSIAERRRENARGTLQ
jgi:hypothetical protein